jgi:hypothetical protein
MDLDMPKIQSGQEGQVFFGQAFSIDFHSAGFDSA